MKVGVNASNLQPGNDNNVVMNVGANGPYFKAGDNASVISDFRGWVRGSI
jgi:hypothetical protein